jgi:hypothetical protein
MDEIVAQEGIDRSGLKLFYYEAYERQFDDDKMCWSSFAPEESFETNVEQPTAARLEGFDVVSFDSGTDPGCSPLSCNSLADELPVNEHCLFATFQEAKDALETGKFKNCEPGPYRIFAVYTVDA